MPMSDGYQQLNQEEKASSDDSVLLHGNPAAHSRKSLISTHTWCMVILSILLLISNSCTWMLSRRSLVVQHSAYDPRTPFAQLERNLPVPFEHESPYAGQDEAEVLRLWANINIDAGVVALSESYSRSHGLHSAQEFPWDSSKRIYLLNGYHLLHCVRAVYISLQEFQHDIPQSRAWSHVLHCLDSLRQDIICNADDSPRYTTETLIPETGMRQQRMCRSWDKLAAWASQHNACYAFVNQTSFNMPESQRFLYCPQDSPYRAAVVAAYGDQVPVYEDLDLWEWTAKDSFDRLIDSA